MEDKELTLPATNVIVPVLDMKVLQEKANEYAMKGAIESIKEYYSGWDSPFRKKIDEELKKQAIGWSLDLPDILALINESLKNEMSVIANNSIAQTYIPMVQKLLTRADKEINFSQILKEFIECVEPEHMDDCDLSVNENTSYGWLDVSIEHEKRSYQLTLHKNREVKKGEVQKYHILRLPYNSYGDSGKDKMTFEMHGGKLDMPFERDVLSDKFLSYIASLIICDSSITMDTKYFDESMFPERCHCD
jgi:hypothetical protein